MIEPVTTIEKQIEVQAARLLDEFRGVFGPETVHREIDRAVERQGHARIRLYVPVFAYRFARESLRAMARSAAGAGSRRAPTTSGATRAGSLREPAGGGAATGNQ